LQVRNFFQSLQLEIDLRTGLRKVAANCIFLANSVTTLLCLQEIRSEPRSGLPDFSWHNLPKRGEEIYQIATYYQMDVCNIFQMVIEYTFYSKVIQNSPNLTFLAWKNTIWQLWPRFKKTISWSPLGTFKMATHPIIHYETRFW
jgi:hypothetical protein